MRRASIPGTGLAFSSNGDGTLSIVKQVSGKYDTVDTVTTERGARTMAVDDKTHKIFLLAAEYGPAPAPKEGQKKGRAPGPAGYLPRIGCRKVNFTAEIRERGENAGNLAGPLRVSSAFSASLR